MIRATWHFTSRLLIEVLIFGLLLFALLLLALRYWVLPNIGDYRADIAAAMSRAVGVPSTLGNVQASWDGLRPRLKFSDVALQGEGERQGLALTEVEGTLSWWTLLVGDLRFHSLEINRPELSVRRDKDGALHVAGIKLGKKSEQGGGFGDWLLDQEEVVIRDAVVTWQDELGNAPELKFRGMALRMQNSGSNHRLGFIATPQAELATPVEVRADMRGTSLLDLNKWSGRVYARMESADVAAWRAWLPVPKELEKGTGGVQVWLDVDGPRISDAIADVQLSDVNARLKPDLPQLTLSSLSGRLGYRDLAPGFNLSGKQLSFTLANSAANVPRADYFFHYAPAKGDSPAKGELLASELNLEALRLVADALPFDGAHRKKLGQFAPKGRAENLAVNWSGEPDAPKTYSAKLKFKDFSVAAVDSFPGLTGMNGDLDSNEAGGTLSLNNKASEVNLPKLFSEPLKLNSLIVQTSWKRKADKLEVNLQNIAFVNSDLEGKLSGKYSTLPNSPGVTDIKASLLRVDAKDLQRYMPLILGEDVRNWLKRALKTGKADNLAVILKGNLAEFPFENDKNGQFRVSAKLSNVDLDYADKWPKVEKLHGDMLFAGQRMEISGSDGIIANAKIDKVDAVIADLRSKDPLLEISGKVSGAVADKIQFLNTSPVNQMIDGFTQGMKATGNGALDLKLALPLAHINDSKVSGEYQFSNNRIEGGKLWPPLDNVTGALAFGGTGVQIQAIRANVFGGPVSINVQSQPGGGMVVDAAGKSDVDAVLTALDIPAQDWLDGVTDWAVKAVVNKNSTDITVDSTLAGIKSDLPQPLRKAAADAMPLRVTRKGSTAEQEQYEVTLGKEISGIFLRTRNEKNEWRMRRGTLALNTNAKLVERDGVVITGALDNLDLDLWRAYLRKTAKPAAAPEPTSGGLSLVGLDLTVSKLIALDKNIGVTKVTAQRNATAWESTIASNDMNGILTWKPEGQGTIVARFKNFGIPENAEGRAVEVKSAAEAPQAIVTEVDFPALDIVAEQFNIRKRPFGRLELLAKPEGRNWRLEKLKLIMPDATLSADGVWLGLPAKPNTSMNLRLEVSDIGNFLGYLGTPNSVKRGTSNIVGQLSWAGNPYEFNPKILSGNFRLEALQGQFLKIESGAGSKLLSLISLQALPRRITLDFRDVFSQGFAFDDMAGSFVIDKGVMTTNNFVINGTAAIVTMEGSVNLASETEDLKVKVIPSIGEGVSIASTLLGGPVVGLVSYVLQKLLKNPFGQIASFQYGITGTWDEPNFQKIQAFSATQTPGWE
jgi:uncharacterized protein (TIGR02099 family)